MTDLTAREQIAALNLAIEEAKSRSRFAVGTPSSVDLTPPPLDARGQAVVRSALQDSFNQNQTLGAPLPDLKELARTRSLRQALESPSYTPGEFVEQQLLNQRRNSLDAANNSLRSRGIDPVNPAEFRPSSVNSPSASPYTSPTSPAARAPAASRPPSNPTTPRITGPDSTPIGRTPRNSGVAAPTHAASLPRPAQQSTWAQPTAEIAAGTGTAALTIPRSPITARPPALARAAGFGRAAVPGAVVGGLLDFGFGIAAGESPARAAAGALGATTGGIVGGAVGGVFFGPVGAIAGGMIGGAAGGWLGDRVGDWLGLPVPTADFPMPGSVPGWPMPMLGQAHVYYRITIKFQFRYRHEPNRAIENQERDVFGWGYLGGMYTDGTNIFMRQGQEWNPNVGGPFPGGFFRVYEHGVSGGEILNPQVVSIAVHYVPPGRQAVEPIPGMAPSARPSPSRHPLNSPAVAYAPGQAVQPGGTPRAAPAQAGEPQPQWIPSGHPAPTQNPAPENLGGHLPEAQPQRAPDGQTEPNTQPQPQPLAHQPADAPHPSPSLVPLNIIHPHPSQVSDHASDPNNPLRGFGGGIPLIPLVAPANTPQTGLRNQPALSNAPGTGNQSAPQPQRTGSTSVGLDDVPTPTCRFRDDPFSPGIDQRTQLIEQINLSMQTFQTQMLNKVDQKLGPQLPGGLSNLLTKVGQTVDKIQELGKKTWDFLQIDRVLAILTWVGVLHNAYMLSSSITQTLFDGIGAILNVFGIEDSEGNSLPVAEIVGEWTEEFMKTLIGEETLDGMKEGWIKANRIYQSALNIIHSVQSMVYSMVEILEVVSNYTGRIGNALLRSGVILADSFNWMNPQANYMDNKFFRTLFKAEDIVESFATAVNEILEIQEGGERLFDQLQEFKQAFQDGIDFISDYENRARANGQQPTMTITPDDELRTEIDT
jgi:hypothetical protein